MWVGERDERRAFLVPGCDLCGGSEREPRLADTARAGEGHELDVVALDERTQLSEFGRRARERSSRPRAA